MSTAFRTFALALGATASLAACSNSSKPVADVLAEDSTLVREVMSANRDSLSEPIDAAAAAPAAATAEPAPPVAVSARDVSPPQTRVSASAAPDAEPRARRVAAIRSVPVSTRNRSARIAQSQVTRSRVATSSVTSSTRVVPAASTQPEPSITGKPTRMRSTALIPAGIELVLAADQQVCASTSKVGDQFGVRFAEDVVGPIGVVIPKGTVATAQVSSVQNDFNMDITSLTVAGHTYPIGSGETDVQVETVRTKSARRAAPVLAGAGLGGALGGVIGRDVKSTVIGAAGGALAGALATRSTYRTDRCVPEGGRITTTLSEPLKIALTE